MHKLFCYADILLTPSQLKITTTGRFRMAFPDLARKQYMKDKHQNCIKVIKLL